MTVYETLSEQLSFIKSKTSLVPEIALTLGSGLGGFADAVNIEAVIPYSDIPSFPVSTVSGHSGRFLFGTIGDKPVVVMQGRVHHYEGYSMQQVVMPTRLMGMLGAKTLLLTNAAGGINKTFFAGDLMLITGHIASFVPSPLNGANIDELGTRFPDMSNVYDSALGDIFFQTARDIGVPLKRGVYIQVPGPQYETPEEIRMFGRLGADAVGMSTACEAIAARHMGIRVCGISCISNMAAGISKTPLSHKDVQETADRIGARFLQLLQAAIVKL